MSLFSPDSKIMQALTRICDLVLLNLLFLLTCLPIFTMGAASAALYDMCFRMYTDEEGGIFLGYFRAFGRNFRQSTPIFLLLLLIAAVAGFDFYLFALQEAPLSYLAILALPILALTAMTYGYAFPLVSQFDNSMGCTLKNALLLAVAYLPRTLCVTALNILPLLLLLRPDVFFDIGIMWVVIYFSATAYVNALILRKVFAPLAQKDTSTGVSQ